MTGRKPEIEDIVDPDFTGGLRSEVYLELLREGLIDGHAHQEINALKRRVSELETERKALEILKRAGVGNPPMPGDELPEPKSEAWAAINETMDGLREIGAISDDEAHSQSAAVASSKIRGHCEGDHYEAHNQQRYTSVWDAIEDDPAEAERMKIASATQMLMRELFDNMDTKLDKALEILKRINGRVSR